MQSNKPKFLKYCSYHKEEPILRVSLNPSSAKIFYCYECLTDINKEEQANFVKFNEFIDKLYEQISSLKIAFNRFGGLLTRMECALGKEKGTHEDQTTLEDIEIANDGIPRVDVTNLQHNIFSQNKAAILSILHGLPPLKGIYYSMWYVLYSKASLYNSNTTSLASKKPSNSLN